MSAYLGFDTELVGVLAIVMRRAADELRPLRCNDPEAADAARTVATAVEALDRWTPIVIGLAGCRALDGYVPTEIASGDLINAWLRAAIGAHGWRTVTDPASALVGPPPPLTATEARALGVALSGSAGSEHLDGAEIEWLSARLDEIAADPRFVAAFLPALTTVGWANVCDQLALRRVELVTDALRGDPTVDPPTSAGVAPIDRAFDALGRVLDVNAAAHPGVEAATLIADMTPMAAALLAERLGLDAQTLASVARRIVEQERHEAPPDHTVLGPRAADIVFRTILDTPYAPAAYVTATIDDPRLVLGVAADAGLGNEVVIAGTTAAALGCTAPSVIPPLVRWMLDAQQYAPYVSGNPGIDVTMAAVVAEHLLAVFRMDGRGFALTSAERHALEAVVTDDRTGALDRLQSIRTPAIDAARATIGDPTADGNAVRAATIDIAAMVAILDALGRAGALHSAQRATDESQATWRVLDKVAGVASSLEGPAGVVVGPAESALHRAADHFGWGPPSMDDVRHHEMRRVDVISSVAAAAIVAARFDALTSAGRIPVGTALPPLPDTDALDVGADYSAAFSAWLDAGRFDADVADQLWAVKETMLSDHESAANAIESVTGI